MKATLPKTELDGRYSSPDAVPAQWSAGETALEQAEVYWLSTVREDGRPHVAPMIGLWIEGALYFSVGPQEQKVKNLSHHPRVVVTTGCNALYKSFDVVIEGEVASVSGAAALHKMVDRFASKYGWQFSVREGELYSDAGGRALAFSVTPQTGYGYVRDGSTFSHTRWRF